MTLPPTRACCSRVRPLGLSILCWSVHHTLETDSALQPGPRLLPTQYGQGWVKLASSHEAVLPFLTIALVTWLWCPWGVITKGNRGEETVAHPRCWQASLSLVSWNERYPDLSYLPLCLWAGPHYELYWQDRCQMSYPWNEVNLSTALNWDSQPLVFKGPLGGSGEIRES